MMKKENGVRLTENKETVLVDVSEVGRKWSDGWQLCNAPTSLVLSLRGALFLGRMV